MREDEKRRVAYHEAGHALVAMSLAHSDPVHRVTIIPRSIGALGATLQLPTEERYLMTRDELFDRLCVMMGGRTAESLVFEDTSTGAENDLERATETARMMVCRFGMSAKESDYAGMLSGGQKRLLEIMRALMLRPRLLLLDEPMSGVHPSIVDEIAGYLETLRNEGMTILMVEHELHMVDRLCDPVVVMAQGKVIGQGGMAALRKQPEIVEAYLVG